MTIYPKKSLLLCISSTIHKIEERGQIIADKNKTNIGAKPLNVDTVFHKIFRFIAVNLCSYAS